MAVQYIWTIPGCRKCIQLLFNMIAFICVLLDSINARGVAFLVASIGGFILSLIVLLIRVLDVDTKTNIPWMKVELMLWIIWAIFYSITSAFVIDVRTADYIAGGVFGLLATVVYLIDGFAALQTILGAFCPSQ